MASDNGSIAVFLALTLCGCTTPPRPVTAVWVRPVAPIVQHQKVPRQPIKQQLLDMQNRLGALEAYLQSSDDAMRRQQFGEDKRWP